MHIGSVRHPRSTILLPLMLLVATFALVGCSKSDAKKAATQAAVRVNSDEITVHQINEVLSKTNNIAPENAAEVKREILDKLVDRQLAVQQAVDKKLERTSSVVSAIEAARSEILARAYLEQLVSAQAKPTLNDAKAYYSSHPELFSQRRVFNLQEITIAARPDLLPALKDQVAKGHSITDIAAWLKAADIKFAANGGARAAEQIPLEILPRIHGLKDGQTLVFDDARVVNITHLASSQAQPVSEEAALPRIQQFLANKQNSEVVQKELAALRAKATIEYLGEFSENAPAPVVKAPEKAAPSTVENAGKGMAGLK